MFRFLNKCYVVAIYFYFFYFFTGSVCLCGELGDSHGGHVSLCLPPQKPQGALHPGNSCGVLPLGTHHADRGAFLQTHLRMFRNASNRVIIKIISESSN